MFTPPDWILMQEVSGAVLRGPSCKEPRERYCFWSKVWVPIDSKLASLSGEPEQIDSAALQILMTEAIQAKNAPQIFIERGGEFFQGGSLRWPWMTYNAERRAFEAYAGCLPKAGGWGRQISEAEFKRRTGGV